MYVCGYNPQDIVSFHQDPLEIFSDYELIADNDASFNVAGRDLKIVARPLIECIARNASELSRKRKRQNKDEPQITMEPSKLYEMSKSLFEFSDRLLETMLKQNATALQGRDSIYSQKCWYDDRCCACQSNIRARQVSSSSVQKTCCQLALRFRAAMQSNFSITIASRPSTNVRSRVSFVHALLEHTFNHLM